MRKPKTAYELARSQVVTPLDTVKLAWAVTHRYRRRFSSVLDLGAGDGRFSFGGRYDSYEGVEIDGPKGPIADLPENASIHRECAFRHNGRGYSACVGNPPYVRQHDLDCTWRDAVAMRLGNATRQTINKKCNLYVYFIFLALQKTVDDGLVSLLVPFEWVSRPSAEPLRKHIERNNWHVDVYRFSEPVFDGVLTTVSLSIIDKRNKDGQWCFHELNAWGVASEMAQVTGSNKKVLPYENRGKLWAKRGMSPGTQKVFALTDGERIHAGLNHDDVLPCVTSLRHLPPDIQCLTSIAFGTHFVEAGRRCWLIRSFTEEMSPRLRAYLDSIPEDRRNTSTCISRKPWYRFPVFDIPGLLISSGFTSFGPKVVKNTIQAYAVGAVCGVYGKEECDWTRLCTFLQGVNFENRVVSYANQFKKVEIRQLNGVLNRFMSWEERDVRTPS